MSDTCPVCRHAAHGKSCPNAASDNDCGCKHDTLTLKQAPAAVPQTRRKATQRWQLKVPDHTDPKYEELNAWFYSTPNAAKGLKGSMIDYMRNLDGSHNGLSWGAAAVRKMKLRWGLALQLVNPRSVTKMIDGIISDVAGMIVAIYEEETGAPQRLLRYTPEEPPWGEMTEEQRQASTAERQRLYDEHKLARKPWDKALQRVNALIAPHYTSISGYRVGDEISIKKETP